MKLIGSRTTIVQCSSKLEKQLQESKSYFLLSKTHSVDFRMHIVVHQKCFMFSLSLKNTLSPLILFIFKIIIKVSYTLVKKMI